MNSGVKRSNKQKKSLSINKRVAANGILLFSFSLIVLGVEERTLTISGHEIYTVPNWSYTVLGTIAATFSILLIIATFNERLAKISSHIVEGSFGYIYWTVFWLVYTVSWLYGVANIPQNEFTFYLLVYVGTVWFIIITIVYFRAILKFIKWLREFSYGKAKNIS